MTAAVWSGPRDVRVQRRPLPAPSPDQALVRVSWTGLCGSDLEEWTHGPVVVRPGVVLGHEVVGVVAVAAADGSGPPAATRVVVDVVTGCGQCWYCQRHQEGLCDRLVVTGQHADGGLADYVPARAARLVPVPPDLSSDRAALAEPLAVAVRAVRRAGVIIGESVVVVGGGVVGMLVAQVARGAGARVAVIEPVLARRVLLESWGVTALWSSSARARRKAVTEVTGPRGPDVVVECAGRAGVTAEALALLARGGRAVLLGVLPRPEPVDVLDLVLGEKVVMGSAAHMWDDDVRAAMTLLAAGLVDVTHLVTHRLPLQAASEAFTLLEQEPESTLKVLVGGGDAAGAGQFDDLT